MKIRRYRGDDAAILPDIFDAAVSITGRNHYDRQQVDVWRTLNPGTTGFANAYGDGRLVFVIVDIKDIPIGFADVERDGHIQFFYCHPDVSGTGMASELLKALEESARSNDIKKLYVEASETAVGLFSRNGFILGERRDLLVGGVPIYNYAMTKSLV